DHDPSCQFYGMEPIIDLAGFPHPERGMCPWHNQDVAVPIPHQTESATYYLDKTPPAIENVTQTPPQDNVQPTDIVHVNATVTDDLTGVKNVTLWYRIGETGTWTPISMEILEGVIYNASIPAQPYCTTVEYYIEAYDNAGNSAKSPITEYYNYHVIPEFANQTIAILMALVLTSLLVVYWKKKIQI
ncbi:hypothetical protein DRO69_06695, partial [Candidatus Bathyarchaeota archaeon]